MRDYPEVARGIVAAMHQQVGDLVVDEDGLALRGVTARHLVMPGLVDDGRAIVSWLAGLSTDLYVNVMDQYRPDHKVLDRDRYADIDRGVTSQEVREVRSAAREAGLWRLDTRWRSF